MMKKILTMSVLIWSFQLNAAEFCANTSAGIQAALTIAQGNNQHNTVKIAEGAYVPPMGGFIYIESSGWDLNISGGWTELMGNPCGQQLSANPYNTVLDGGGLTRIMEIQPGGNSDITISNLLFLNGGNADMNYCGGLCFNTYVASPHAGRATIERNVFINNRARFSSAIYFVGSGSKSHIRNNIFTLNYTYNGNYTITIIQDEESGGYFTNNTVVNNAGDSVSNWGGVDIFASDNAKFYIGNNVIYDNGDNDLNLRGDGDYEIYLFYNNVGMRTGIIPSFSIGNFSDDPEFNKGVLEFTPSYGSPLVNAGFDPPNAVPIPTPFELAWFEGTVDLVGNIRKQLGKVDIGAIETSSEPPIFINGFE